MADWGYARYRPFREQLAQAASAWFASHGFETDARYTYSLKSAEDWKQNIILPEVANHIESLTRTASLKLHSKSNGLSSQIMAFNLLGPFQLRDDLTTLARLLLNDAPNPDEQLTLAFEFEDRDVFNERQQQPTSIDACLSGATIGIYVEVKLQESGFGACSSATNGDCEGMNPASDFDSCYLHAGAKRTYWEHLADYGFLGGPFFTGPICPLAMHYQFFREVAFAIAKGGAFVLLVDERNPAFNRTGPTERGLFPFLKSSVPVKYQSRVKCVTVQSVIAGIRTSEKHRDWVFEFEAKYGL
jgi:hypothetical protein